MNKSTNKRLAKNTIFLYFRMLITMAVTFFTTRVVLDKLGVDDYGIFNTIGGVTVLFVYINNVMISSTQRFLNYYMGKDETHNVKLYFSLSLLLHLIIGIISIIVTEGVGLWFLYNKMVLPPERFNAAFWVLHITTLITFSRIIRTPYNACIIAYERMDFYAYISIVDVVLKLAIVYLLTIINMDKLILYACLGMAVSYFITFVYKYYCNHNFPISKFQLQWNKNSFNDLLSFSSYSLLGNMANMASQTMVNLVINTFYGVVVNAAVGISNQLSKGIYGFIVNFQIAFNPIIIKTYAKNEFIQLKQLIFRVSKLSYYLMFCLSLPVMFYTNEIFGLWLGEVPTFTVGLCHMTILTMLVNSLAEPLWKTVQASGQIKKYQIVVSIIIILALPLSYIALRMGFSPVFVFGVKLFVIFCAYLYRLYYANSLIHFSIIQYVREIILPVIFVSFVSLTLSYVVVCLGYHYFASSILLVVLTLLVIYFIGTTTSEKQFFIEIMKKKFKR